ncbi:MAG: DUF1127 domain-containing protein [Alphaproteobacteria bacterium]|nr:DUF1127 domain-containing protein [Alphaproteobacteria bacterium]
MSRLPKTPRAYSEILVSFPPRATAPLPQAGKWAGPVPLVRGHLDEIVAEAREDRGRFMRAAALSTVRIAMAPLQALAGAWRAWRVRQRDLEELAQLDDRTLRDMGISRYDALMAAKDDDRRD